VFGSCKKVRDISDSFCILKHVMLKERNIGLAFVIWWTFVGCNCRLQYQRMILSFLMELVTRKPSQEDVNRFMLLRFCCP
jgi:hypothetical protein